MLTGGQEQRRILAVRSESQLSDQKKRCEENVSRQ
jgi:hypothetical protein